jgi:hypothetical protein
LKSGPQITRDLTTGGAVFPKPVDATPYYFRREPCPFCGGGPLMFITCRSCGAVFAWCGEQDHAVGVYDGKDLRELGLGETRDWASKGCPVCKGREMGYSSGKDVKGLGFTSGEVLLCQSGDSEYVEDPNF